MKKSSINYRQEALKARTSSERLNQLIQVTTRKSWVLLWTVLIILLFVILWSIFGRVTTRLKGEGILLATQGSLYDAEAPEGEGRIVRIPVHVGDIVDKNAVIADLVTPNLKDEVANIENYLQSLQNKYQQLENNSKIEIQQRQTSVEEQNTSLKKIITEQNANLASISQLLNIRQTYLKKGLVTRQDVVSTLQDYYRTKNEIDTANQKIVDNQINLSNFKDQWRERLRELDLTIRAKQAERDNLKSQLTTGQHVYSPIRGVVTAILAQIGDTVKGGTPIANVALLNQGMDAIAYIPYENAKLVRKGMVALVSPTHLKKEEYGSMIGKVMTISNYPSTKSSMMAVLQNEDLVTRLLESNPPFEIRIHLEQDALSYSRFKWTSSKGPNVTITPGTIVEARVDVKQQRPISLILPAFKKLLGE